MAKDIWGGDIPAGTTLTDDIYWASVRPELRVLRRYQNEHGSLAKEAKAAEFAALGYPVDVHVMAYGVPIITQMKVMAQIHGLGNYYLIENGRQKISFSAQDFPAWPDPPKDATDWVSPNRVEGFEDKPYYEPTEAGRPIPIGTTVSEDKATFIKLAPGAIPGGPQTAYGWWLKVG